MLSHRVVLCPPLKVNAPTLPSPTMLKQWARRYPSALVSADAIILRAIVAAIPAPDRVQWRGSYPRVQTSSMPSLFDQILESCQPQRVPRRKKHLDKYCVGCSEESEMWRVTFKITGRLERVSIPFSSEK